MNIHDEEHSGYPTVITDNLLAEVSEKNCENRCSTVSELLIAHANVSWPVIYDILTKTGLQKVLCQMDSKNDNQ